MKTAKRLLHFVVAFLFLDLSDVGSGISLGVWSADISSSTQTQRTQQNPGAGGQTPPNPADFKDVPPRQ